MQKSYLFFNFKKNFYYFVLFFFVVIFVCVRLAQLIFFIDVQTGICHEFKIFEIAFFTWSFVFFIFSLMFFKFKIKPKLKTLNSFFGKKFLGFLSIFVAIVVLINSIGILFQTFDKNSSNFFYCLILFLSGVFLTFSFVFLSVGFLKNSKLEFKLKCFFCFSFFWLVARSIHFILSDIFLQITQLEYKLNILGFISLFLFIFQIGQIIFNYNKSNASLKLFIYGFFSFFFIFSNVSAKLIFQIYNFFNNNNILNNNILKSLDIFNVYAYNFTDFSFAIFNLFFLIFLKSQNFINSKILK